MAESFKRSSSFKSARQQARWSWTCCDWAWDRKRESAPHRNGCAWLAAQATGADGVSCNCKRRLAYLRHWWYRPIMWGVDHDWLRRALFCRRGHFVIDDHCGKPAHRYCIRCNTATPDAELD